MRIVKAHSPNPNLHLVQKLDQGNRSAQIMSDGSNEFVVQLYEDGKRLQGKDAFCADRTDANTVAKRWVNKISK